MYVCMYVCMYVVLVSFCFYVRVSRRIFQVVFEAQQSARGHKAIFVILGDEHGSTYTWSYLLPSFAALNLFSTDPNCFRVLLKVLTLRQKPPLKLLSAPSELRALSGASAAASAGSWP